MIPEEVARRLCPLSGHPTGAWSPSPDCRCKAVASALRAACVAGLNMAAALFDGGGDKTMYRTNAAAEIRGLADRFNRESNATPTSDIQQP